MNDLSPTLTTIEGISSSPSFSGIKVQEIDLEDDLLPLTNLYSLPIFGPEMIEKFFLIFSISTNGLLSISFILIV